jgi:hypothetical protein
MYQRFGWVLAAAMLAAAAGPARGLELSGASQAALHPQLRISMGTLQSSRGFALVPPLAPVLSTSQGADTDQGAGLSILTGALYGGAAGALIGLGVGLIEADNYFRDIAIGAGAGIIVGGSFGAARALRDTRAYRDGLSSPDRTPVLHGTRFSLLAGRF